MSFLVYYLIIHLCVSMHACNSRHLRAFHKEPEKEFPVTSKIPEIMAGIEGRKYNENIMEQKEPMVLSDEQNTRKGAGNDTMLQISQVESNIEGWKNRARSTKQQDSKEAINNSKDNSITEDVVVMDYAQPHRKPPIHNIEP